MGSIQKGYDVNNYVMNCFGGAGGQHACHVADALGISKVLIHPYAGVLSAYGMGLAEIRSIREGHLEQNIENNLYTVGGAQKVVTLCFFIISKSLFGI